MLRVPVYRLDESMSQALLRRIGHKCTRSAFQQIHLHRQHRIQETHIVHIHIHLYHLLDFRDDIRLRPQIRTRIREPLGDLGRIRRAR